MDSRWKRLSGAHIIGKINVPLCLKLRIESESFSAIAFTVRPYHHVHTYICIHINDGMPILLTCSLKCPPTISVRILSIHIDPTECYYCSEWLLATGCWLLPYYMQCIYKPVLICSPRYSSFNANM